MKFLQTFNWEKYDEARKLGMHLSEKAGEAGHATVAVSSRKTHTDAMLAHKAAAAAWSKTALHTPSTPTLKEAKANFSHHEDMEEHHKGMAKSMAKEPKEAGAPKAKTEKAVTPPRAEAPKAAASSGGGKSSDHEDIRHALAESSRLIAEGKWVDGVNMRNAATSIRNGNSRPANVSLLDHGKKYLG